MISEPPRSWLPATQPAALRSLCTLESSHRSPFTVQDLKERLHKLVPSLHVGRVRPRPRKQERVRTRARRRYGNCIEKRRPRLSLYNRSQSQRHTPHECRGFQPSDLFRRKMSSSDLPARTLGRTMGICTVELPKLKQKCHTLGGMPPMSRY
jgi:hypothetical protein